LIDVHLWIRELQMKVLGESSGVGWYDRYPHLARVPIVGAGFEATAAGTGGVIAALATVSMSGVVPDPGTRAAGHGVTADPTPAVKTDPTDVVAGNPEVAQAA